MDSKWVFSILLCIAPNAIAQAAIPHGTIIPLSLDTGLNAAKIRSGQQIRATVILLQ